MIFKEKHIQLKGRKQALLRSPQKEDAQEMLEYLKACSLETHFLLREPEECTMTEEEEKFYLESVNVSNTQVMIACVVDGKIVGNCGLHFNQLRKTRHRATLGIGLLKEYWNQGIGTALMEALIEFAKEKGIFQFELEVMEDNYRAKALYEKLGFQTVAKKPNAICLKDGNLLKEEFMIKIL